MHDDNRKRAEVKARTDYLRHLGCVLLADEIDGYRDDYSFTESLDPPAIVRVCKTDEQSIIRWMDDGWIDPVWDVELIVPHRQLANARSFWVYGTSYNANGSTEPSRWRIASRDQAARALLVGRAQQACLAVCRFAKKAHTAIQHWREREQ